MAIEAKVLRDAALFDAQSINDSDRVISVFAAPEWDELSIDGKEWVRAIIAETLSRHRSALAEDTARAVGEMRERCAEIARYEAEKARMAMSGGCDGASYLKAKNDVASSIAALIRALPLAKEAAR